MTERRWRWPSTTMAALAAATIGVLSGAGTAAWAAPVDRPPPPTVEPGTVQRGEPLRVSGVCPLELFPGEDDIDVEIQVNYHVAANTVAAADGSFRVIVPGAVTETLPARDDDGVMVSCVGYNAEYWSLPTYFTVTAGTPTSTPGSTRPTAGGPTAPPGATGSSTPASSVPAATAQPPAGGGDGPGAEGETTDGSLPATGFAAGPVAGAGIGGLLIGGLLLAGSRRRRHRAL